MLEREHSEQCSGEAPWSSASRVLSHPFSTARKVAVFPVVVQAFYPQLLQQRLGLLEVGGVKALAEPAVNLCQHLVNFVTLALLLPQTAQPHYSLQFQRLRMLAAGNVDGLTKRGFCLVPRGAFHTRHYRGPQGLVPAQCG